MKFIFLPPFHTLGAHSEPRQIRFPSTREAQWRQKEVLRGGQRRKAGQICPGLAELTQLNSVHTTRKTGQICPVLARPASDPLHSPQRVEFRLHVLLLETL